MDVSKLCSGSSTDTAAFTPKITPSSLDFILSPYKEPVQTVANDLIIDECSKLCQGIWQLKLQHKSISEQERETMIEGLSNTAHHLFKSIRLPGTWDNKKRALCPLQKYEDEEDEDEDEEDDEEEEINDETNLSLKFKDHAEYELIRQARNLQDAQARPKYRRRNRRSMIGQKCHSCRTTETPEWRRGPDGARTLCNACGLHYSKLIRKGSIGVQTQNYLLTSGIQPQTSSIVSATAISDDDKRLQIANGPTSSLTNFPFVLMDSKYGLEKSNSTAQHSPFYTQSSSVSTDSSVNISSTQLPPPQEQTHQYTINPLRIHQWKQQ